MEHTQHKVENDQWEIIDLGFLFVFYLSFRAIPLVVVVVGWPCKLQFE
jgi:hypothetical protein